MAHWDIPPSNQVTHNPGSKGCPKIFQFREIIRTLPKTPLHVPETDIHLRQGLSNMLYAPTTPEGVAFAPPVGHHLFCDMVPSFSRSSFLLHHHDDERRCR